MTLPPFSRQFQRLSAVLLLLAVVMAGMSLGILPIFDGLVADRETLADLGGQIARYRTLAEARPHYQRRLGELHGRWQALQGQLLGGDNAALAGAAVQGSVKAIVEDRGGRIVSFQTLPAVAEKDLSRVTVRVEFGLPMASLREVLMAVSQARPMLLLDNIEIRTSDASGMGRAGGWLTLRWDLSGYQSAVRP